MASADLARIKLGPGAQILEDAPENQDLLAQLQSTDPVTTLDLLKLSIFFRAYRTNEPLADHLARLALGQIVDLPLVQDVMKAAIPAIPADDAGDVFWDTILGYGPYTEDRDAPPFIAFNPTPLWVLFSGIGLLFESQATGANTTHYYVIGVCPDPAGLTIEALVQRNS